MVWIKETPMLNGEWYWWRPIGEDNNDAIPVKFNADSYYVDGEWSHRPIPFPTDNKEEKERVMLRRQMTS